jgi:class 3 adenylate cyclase
VTDRVTDRGSKIDRADRPSPAPGRARPAGSGQRRRTISLAFTLAASIGGLVAVAVIAVLGVALLASTRNTLDLLTEKADLTIDLIETQVRGHLEAAADQLEFLASLERSGSYDTVDAEEVARVFAGATRAAPQLLTVLRFDRDHRMTGIGRVDGTAGPLDADMRHDPQVAAAFDRLRGSTGAYWGDVIHIETMGTSALNLRYPVRRETRLVAMLVAAVSVDELSRFLARLDTGEADGTAFILYGNDRVLAHPRFVAHRPAMTEDRPVPSLDAAGDPVLAALWGRGEPVPVGGTVRARAIEGVAGDHLVLFRPLRGYAAETLLLGIHYPEAAVIAPLRRLVGSAVIGLVVMLVAVAAGVWLGRRIARPTIRLAQQASALGEGLEFRGTRDLPRSRFTELDAQARAFNRLLHGLRWLEPYVPRQLVRRLIAQGEDTGLPSVERELTVLFTDIGGFTTAAEHLPAQETAAFLNEHFALLGACVEAEGGTIDKFIGDSLMAFWGAPEHQPDHAQRAARAALAIAGAVRADNARRRADGRQAVHLRIGIHTGRMVAGDIGAPGRMNYTIVGDAVNIGNRLEELGKTLAPQDEVVVLASGETVAGLGRDMPLAPLGPQPVRGRDEAIEVYRLG